VIDAAVYRVVFRGMKLGGIILIMIGFLVVLLPDNWNQYIADLMRSKFTRWKKRGQSTGALTATAKMSTKKNGKVQDTSTAQLSRLRTPSGRVK